MIYSVHLSGPDTYMKYRLPTLVMRNVCTTERAVGLTITKQYCAHTDASPNSRGHHGAVGLAPGYAEDDQIRYDQEETDDQGDCPISNGELLFDEGRFFRLTPVGPQCQYHADCTRRNISRPERRWSQL